MHYVLLDPAVAIDQGPGNLLLSGCRTNKQLQTSILYVLLLFISSPRLVCEVLRLARLSVCLSVRSHMPKTTRSDFTTFV